MVTAANPRDVAVVQFPHPGSEWWPDTGTEERAWTDWTDGHARKFVHHSGQYVDQSGNLAEGFMTFWAEWEGPSSCTPTRSDGLGAPAWFQRPKRGNLADIPHPQNTDPYVFGSFLYSNCMQDHEWPKKSGMYRPTAMTTLAPGSLILFGSTRAQTSPGARDFVLDTCFVVGAVIEIDGTNFLKQVEGHVPAAFIDATLIPIFRDASSRTLSLYIGARRGHNASIFSFFPCQPVADQPIAFPRPVIQPVGPLKDFINPRSSQRFRRRLCDVATAEAAWSEVRRQVEAAGCGLGVYADPL